MVIEFDVSAKYDLPGTEDDDDVNKLFGWGYVNGGHHKDSVRFGWSWNNTENKVHLWAYCYRNSERVIMSICQIPRHKKVLCIIEKVSGMYHFQVRDPIETYFLLGEAAVTYSHNKKLSYRLGCYFGGNNPSPHDITIQIKRK